MERERKKYGSTTSCKVPKYVASILASIAVAVERTCRALSGNAEKAYHWIKIPNGPISKW